MRDLEIYHESEDDEAIADDLQRVVDLPELLFGMVRMGLADKQIAEVLKVNVGTINKWKHEFPKVKEAFFRGKVLADVEVVNSLYDCANGYEKEIETVSVWKGDITKATHKQYFKKDSAAAMKILSKKQPEVWADKQIVETTNTNINIAKIDMSSLTTEQLALMEQIHMKQLKEDVRGN